MSEIKNEGTYGTGPSRLSSEYARAKIANFATVYIGEVQNCNGQILRIDERKNLVWLEP